MDFSRRRRDHRSVVDISIKYPHVLNMYSTPPTEVITLEEFEDIAIERVKLLRLVEQTTLMGHKIYTKAWKESFCNYCRKDGLKKYVRLIESSGNGISDADESIRRVDYLSHFILRLAYCRSEDLRRWFLHRELELFKVRFMNLTPDSVKEFIKVNKLEYVPISQEEKSKVESKLVESTYGMSNAAVQSTDFFKVHFTEVPTLCAKRQVYLQNGYAYVPINELFNSIISLFRMSLNGSLTRAVKCLPTLNDDRLTELLKTLNTVYTGIDYNKILSEQADNSIPIESLDCLSRTSFPLCMRTLHETLRSTHHLKHFGRLQYGLFIKGIGVTLENAIEFWRSELSHSVGEDKFNKSYLYNVKHMYGAIGGGMKYSPYSCVKIIMGNSQDGHCGCPFQSWNSAKLLAKFREYGFPESGITEILEPKNAGHYQIACAKYYMFAHSQVQNSIPIHHPNQYFVESRKLLTNEPKQTFKKQRIVKEEKRNVSVSLDDNFDLSQVDESILNSTANVE